MFGEKFHPIMEIAKNCVELQAAAEAIEIPKAETEEGESVDETIIVDATARRFSALKSANAEWSRMAEYTEPKLKAIEIEGNLTHNLHEDLLDELDDIANDKRQRD